MRALVNQAEFGFDIKGSKSPTVETLDCYGQGIDLTVLFRLRSYLSTREDLQFRWNKMICMHIDEQWLKTLVDIERYYPINLYC